MPHHLSRFIADPAEIPLDRAGRVTFPEPRAPFDIAIINPARAGTLADAFLLSWGQFQWSTWDAQRGEPFRWDQLRRDPRVLFAESPYTRFPDTAHPADRRHYGPRYLVHYLDPAGEVALTIAVSAYATDLRVGRDGRIVQPRLGGEYFKTAAVAKNMRSRTGYVAVLPEDAISHVGRASGARVAGRPRLLLLPDPWHPVLAQWELPLERPVTVRGPTGTKQRDRVYFGPRGVAVPTREQSEGESIQYVREIGRGREPDQFGNSFLRFVSGAAVDFEQVTLQPDGDS